jgi:hypothetical protein
MIDEIRRSTYLRFAKGDGVRRNCPRVTGPKANDSYGHLAPKEAAPMARTNDRTAYCHRQAAECASAAAATTLSEAREAYLNMQQAWLQLAPDLASNPSAADKPEAELEESIVEPNKV